MKKIIYQTPSIKVYGVQPIRAIATSMDDSIGKGNSDNDLNEEDFF